MSVERFCQPAGTYLLSHSVGLLPKETERWVTQGLIESWRTDPAQAWPSWMHEVEEFRLSLARLFNHDPEWFCPQANVSSGVSKVLHALPCKQDKPVILLSADDFPSIGFVCQAAERFGFQVRFIDRGADCQDPKVWADHLGPEVGVVVITQVHANSGRLLPVSEIADLARQNESYTIVDVAQSAGIIPIDLAELDVDFVVGSCVKWLCGGPGAGFVWVRPDVLEDCAPTDVGWFSHSDPFEFDITHFRYADDALRFWGGTPNVASLSIARRSIDVVNRIGVGAIRTHNLNLTSQLIDGIDQNAVTVASPSEPARRSGTVVITGESGSHELTKCLSGANFSVDDRSLGVRISPHVYNTPEEIDRLIDVLRYASTQGSDAPAT